MYKILLDYGLDNYLKKPLFLHVRHDPFKSHATSACLTVTFMLLCRGLSYDAIVQHETLRMAAQAEQLHVMALMAEQLHVMALMAVLPVRLKLLDIAGGQPYSTTLEPGLPLSRPRTSTQAQTAADGAAGSAQQVWPMFRPGHYEVVYPAEGFEDHNGAV